MLRAMATKFGLGAEIQSPTGLCQSHSMLKVLLDTVKCLYIQKKIYKLKLLH